MNVNTLDPISREYFLQEGREIGFLRECINERSIREKAAAGGFSVQRWEEIRFDGTTVSVYAVPRSSLSAFESAGCPASGAVGCSGTDSGPDPGEKPSEDGVLLDLERQCDTEYPDLIFVAEYPTDEVGEDFCTYVFVTEPDADSLRRAHTIQRLKHELCFGELDPTYVCRECGKRTHWLSTPRKEANPFSVPVDVKYRAVSRQVCGRADSPTPKA